MNTADKKVSQALLQFCSIKKPINHIDSIAPWDLQIAKPSKSLSLFKIQPEQIKTTRKSFRRSKNNFYKQQVQPSKSCLLNKISRRKMNQHKQLVVASKILTLNNDRQKRYIQQQVLKKDTRPAQKLIQRLIQKKYGQQNKCPLLCSKEKYKKIGFIKPQRYHIRQKLRGLLASKL